MRAIGLVPGIIAANHLNLSFQCFISNLHIVLKVSIQMVHGAVSEIALHVHQLNDRLLV